MILTSLLIFVLSTQFSFAACSWFNPVGCATDTFSSLKLLFSVEGIIDIVFRILNFAIDNVLAPLVGISGWIFDWSLSLVVNANTSIVATGWGKSLDLANNLFILILLGIAIGTILELPTFNYKTMLPKFLMVALLINFSLAIGNVIIGFTNVLTGSFYKEITSETLANRLKVVEPIKKADEKFKKDIESSENSALKEPIKLFTENFFLFVYKTFTYLLVIFVFLAGAVFMIARTFHLWLLLMLAPLAWISLLIPGLQQHWKSWWSKFIKWSIFAPAYLFFLWLGVRIGNASALKGFVSGYSNYGVFTNVTGYILQMLVVAFIMMSGLVISSQLGVGGSNFVINYGKNLKGAASKRFKELRSKGPLSAEKLGAKFGGMGAGLLAKSRIGAVAGYGRETREKLEQEKLQEAQKKETLINLRMQLDATTDPELRLGILKQIRAAVGGKSDLDKIKDIIAESEKNKPGGASTSTAPAPTGGATP